MGQGLLGLFFSLGIWTSAGAESLPIAPRRQDDLDQVPKVIFSSTNGIDPAEGFDAVGGAPAQAAPLKTAETPKVGEKVQKLKQTPPDELRKPTKSASKKSGSYRKPATTKGQPRKKSIR